MRIHTIKIRRIREIESLDIECSDHSMIAIVGENGSGKTTVFFSLLFALTGVLTLKGQKKEHVRDVGDGPAWVEVTFELNGRMMTIRRSMNSASCTLTAGSETSIKGATKVNSWLLEQGLEPDRVIQAFLPQGDADALFKASDAERAAASLRIFGMADIECYDDALKSAAEPLNQRIDLTLEDRLEEAQAQRVIAEGQLKEADGKLTGATEKRSVLAEAEAVIRKAEERRAADSKRAETLALKERDATDRKQLAKELEEELETVQRLRQQVNSTSEAYDQAKATIYAAEQFKKDAVQRVHLVQRLDQAERDLYQYEQWLEEAQKRQQAAGDLAELREQLQGVTKQLEVTKAVQTYRDRQKASRARMSKALSDRDTLTKALGEKSSPEELQVDRQFFADKLALWRHQQTHAQDGRCATCGQEWADVPSPKKLAELIQEGENALRSVDKLIEERAFLEGELKQASRDAALAQEAIDCDEVEIQRLVEQAGVVELADIEELQSSEESLETKIEKADQTASDVRELQHAVEMRKQEVQNCGDQIAALQGRKVPAHEVAEAEQFTVAYEEQKQQMQAAATRQEMLAKRVHDIDTRLVNYDAELERLRELTEGEDTDTEMVSQAQSIIADRDAIHAEYDAAVAEHAGVKREFEMFDRQVSDLNAKLAQQKIDRKKLDVIRGARFILHRDQLPRFVCAYYTELVSQQWAEELERFGAKFTAWQDPESLEFYARFENGNERRVYQLSGGERQLAIVAYLRTINRLFAPDLGIIGFDEPTTHVDERFRPVIAEVFRRMAAQAEDEGLQVFVVDHAPEFLSAIPAAIRLQKSS